MAEFTGGLNYHVFKDYNIPFDEKSSSYGSVRKIQWVKEGNEPDESKAKVEIRKIYVNANGETVGKGYAFSTPEGPSELVVGMIGAGFGNTKDILKAVAQRKDFIEAAKTINDDEDEGNDGEMFDMRELLLSMNEEDEDDVENAG